MYILATCNVTAASIGSVSTERRKTTVSHSFPPVSKDEIKIGAVHSIAPVPKEDIKAASGGGYKVSDQIHKEGKLVEIINLLNVWLVQVDLVTLVTVFF